MEGGVEEEHRHRPVDATEQVRETTPPPPKLTVRVALSGNVSTAT